jgi:hypothetical protein
MTKMHTGVQNRTDLMQIPSGATLRFVYLGKLFDNKKTLGDQNFNESHVVQVLVAGDFRS